MDKLIFSGTEITPDLIDIISAGGQPTIVVTGTSMRPYLKHGRDAVRLKLWKETNLQCGQILLFQRLDRSLVLHRVRKMLPDGKLLMNGDGQAWCETISREQVIGVVSSVARKGRYIPCDSLRFRLWNWLWYPTRPIRPLLFKMWRVLFFRKEGRYGSFG